MLYRQIPGTTLNCSAICLGTAVMGTSIGEADAFRLLDTFVDMGGNFIDTANCYANWMECVEQSASEKTIGRWLQQRALGGKIIVGTKGGHPHFRPPTGPRLSPCELWSDVDDSLSNLQVDTIDLYWLHRDDPSRPVEEILSTLNGMVSAGRIRHFGCSNWRAPRILEALSTARARGWQSFVGDQPMWSLAVVDHGAIGDPTMTAMDDDLKAMHLATRMAAIPYSGQANGLFSKMASGTLHTLSAFHSRMYSSHENDVRFGRLKELSTELGLTASQISLGYLMGQPFTTIPIVGCNTVTQLVDSLSAADVELSPAQVSYLEAGALS